MNPGVLFLVALWPTAVSYTHLEDQQPGHQGKPGMDLLKQQSESIKQQLEQMIEQMKSGNPQQMGKQMGESLIMHEMMQQMLREIMNLSLIHICFGY